MRVRRAVFQQESPSVARRLPLLALVVLVTPVFAAEGTGHGDPVAPVLMSLAVILLAAKLGGDLAVRIGQPSVLGELVLGVVLGNLSMVGVSVFESMKTDTMIDMLSRIGVIILLFEGRRGGAACPSEWSDAMRRSRVFSEAPCCHE